MHPPQRFVTLPGSTFSSAGSADSQGPLQMSYRELGAGQPVLLLHGWPTSSFLWRDVMPHLAAQGLRPIALDLPGFGHTPPPPGQRLGFSTYDRAIEAFVHALGLDGAPLGLVVHDAGGPIGLHWASQHPHRVSRLAILNTLIYPEVSWAVVAFVAATRAPLISGLIARPSAIRLALRFGVHKRKVPPEVLDE
ncbi:MAG TPA: alpha/beta fold hydrolase, partial [Myxococcota bacterium]|nr:alpha/beta fold hydrolase [Myxococcota bacterium]